MTFNKETYQNRRARLKSQMTDGLILLLGNVDVPMNYRSNTYHFRQDSSFLYFFGIDQQGLAAVIDIDSGEETLFGDDATLDDIIWMGPQPLLRDKALAAGVMHTAPSSKLFNSVKQALESKRKLHFLPPYRAENKLKLEKLLEIHPDEQLDRASKDLIKAVVALRSIKEDQEVAEIEKAIDTAWLMHTTAMKMARPGVYEYEIAGALEGIAAASGGTLSFPLILSKRGETLHNHYHGNRLEAGDLLLVDGGCELASHYATDHTRTFPVGGKFSNKQKDVYQVVLAAEMTAIEAIRPGLTYKGIHLMAAEVIANGLRDLGLMKGDIPSAVAQGAHALFFPHGLGHMMGLDVHDMEDLGENHVGYDEEVKRSGIFGTAYLRLGKKLQPGFVLTVEPGIYFIPALIAKWAAEKKFAEYINYDRVKEYIGFGGIRIEDDVLVTGNGYRLLGKPIPKTVNELESIR